MWSLCVSGSGVRAAEQRRERVQPGSDHLQGPGGSLRLHQRPPEADPAGHDRTREERGGGGQVATTHTPHLLMEVDYSCTWNSHPSYLN